MTSRYSYEAEALYGDMEQDGEPRRSNYGKVRFLDHPLTGPDGSWPAGVTLSSLPAPPVGWNK